MLLNNKNTRIRYERINESLTPLRVAKDNTIHRVGEIAKKVPILRIPLMCVLFIFLFIYDLFLNLFIHWKMRERLARALAMMLTVALVFSNVGLAIYATDIVSDPQSEEEIIESQELDEGESDEGDPDEDSDESSEGEGEESSDESEGEEAEETEKDPEELESELEEKDLEKETLEEEEQVAAFDQSEVFGDVEITVSAPEGVFPAGSSLKIEKITNSHEIEEIEQLVADKLDESTPKDVDTVVEKSYTFDIKVLNEDGEEIEPDLSKGEAVVTFKNVGAAEAEEEDDKDINVFYVSDDLDKVEAVDSDIDADEDSASISAEHFSIYTVVITTGVKQGAVLKYYQGITKATSYFTIYDEDELALYRDLINSYVDGSLASSDKIETILVNSDDNNPSEGITGNGQSKSMTVSDLNLSVKIMDDITVTKSWTPITKIPTGVKFDGGCHTIEFKDSALSSDVKASANETYGVLIGTSLGSVAGVTIIYDGKTITIDGEIDSTPYAAVTIRVDGKKAEIGEAITGAEALAISADGESYLTLERTDDLGVYRTKLENLEEEKTYNVYYVYENENETIAAVSFTRSEDAEDYTKELNFVSVTYDMEHINTYSKDSNGHLSEKVMAAVRVVKNGNGTYTALEDYTATVMANEGHSVPTKAKNVKITIAGEEKTVSTEESANCRYIYDHEEKTGDIFVSKSLITGPMVVEVAADSLEDSPKNTIELYTYGGTVSDPIWTKTGKSVYKLDVYEDITLPTNVVSLNSSSNVKFAGWYKDINYKVKESKYTYSEDNVNKTQKYYAKWVIDKAENDNGKIKYFGRSVMDIRGISGGYIKTTYGDAGFSYYVNGSSLSLPATTNSDIFTPVPGKSGLYIGRIYTIDGQYVTVTHIIQNRSGSDVSTNFYLSEDADVQIGSVDSAPMSYHEEGNSKYILMTDGNTAFRVYVDAPDMGVDAMNGWWYGKYSNRSSYKTTNEKFKSNVTGIDTGMAFNWYISDVIPKDGYITRTTKMGVGKASSLGGIKVTAEAGAGVFSSGKNREQLSSSSDSVKIAEGNKLVAKNGDASTTLMPPTRTGYVFSHWSAEEDGVAIPVGTEFTTDKILYACYVPKPDKSVTNNSSVQKVDGSRELVVPSQLGRIVITNTTPGVDADKKIIEQGATQVESAGYSSGFSGVLSLEGEDDRYLMPDDIEVKIVPRDGSAPVILTKNTGYTYSVWNNRRKADIDIRKQYINGDVEITAIGYELPPVTATSIDIAAAKSTIKYGEKAVFTASANTSKNHVASYQWYIAPYYQSEPIDGKVYWNFPGMNGVALQNGTNTVNFGVGTSIDNNSTLKGKYGDMTLTVTGADKSTLRISGLEKNAFYDDATIHADEAAVANGLHLGGYHVYCVVTSTRNITGEVAIATSKTVEVEVEDGKYDAPTGLEGSATTYYGKSDGTIQIEHQVNRPPMQYKNENEATWKSVTNEQLTAGVITGLAAGHYQFKYPADANNHESATTTVVVDNGKYIIVTYRAPGADNESLRTQYKHVVYGSTVTPSTPSKVAEDGTIQNPARTGYTFEKWSDESIVNITANTTVTAKYNCAVYNITLDNQGATTAGTSAIYEKYSEGFYLDLACTETNKLGSSRGIAVPEKDKHNFLGYFTSAEGGEKIINADGQLSAAVTNTRYLANTTLYAQWEEKGVDFKMSSAVYLLDQSPMAYSSNGISMSIAKTDASEGDSIEKEGFKANTSYNVTIRNTTGQSANRILIYSDGVLKDTKEVTLNNNGSVTLTIVPRDYGGGTISLVAAYSAAPGDTDASSLTYTIAYKDVSSSKTGAPFTGTFTETAPASGVKGVATILPEATKTGYTFGGWFVTGRGAGSPIDEIAATNTEDAVTVYAKWTPLTYRVTLVSNDGTYADGLELPTEYRHGDENIALPGSSQITRKNYRFLGWFDNAQCSGNPVTYIDSSQVGDVVYYASWEILPLRTVTLTPDGHGGSIYTIEPADGYNLDEGSSSVATVYEGDDFEFSVSTASAYGIKSVKADGKILTPDDGIYKLDNIIDDVTVTVVTETLALTEFNDNAEATIVLADGTTGYFATVNEAIVYATKHGSDSVIKLRKNLVAADIDAVPGNRFTLDLNGHTLGDNAKVLIEGGADCKLTNSGEDVVCNNLEVENNGNFTNELTVAKLTNNGVAINDGIVTVLDQKASEYYAKSKFVNNGDIGTATLSSGYFVENKLDSAPAGLDRSSYSTIMNGNEYYHTFQDAVDIANSAGSDSTITMLNTYDNNGKTINVGNDGGHKITVDLSKVSSSPAIAAGDIIVNGDVEFRNDGAVVDRNITSDITNNGSLVIGSRVKINGTDIVNNKDITVEENATVSSTNLENKESGAIVNNGMLTSHVTNEGELTNNGTMNNVTQTAGRMMNHGSMNGTMQLDGGTYKPYVDDGATPAVPTGTVAYSGSNPRTYYATLKDIAEGANGNTDENPFEVHILENIGDTDMGSDPVVFNAPIPVVIKLDGHQINGQGSINITGGSIDIETTGSGGIGTNTTINVGQGGALDNSAPVTISGPVNNGGTFTNEGTVTGTVTNTGSTTNNGNMDTVNQKGGTLNNGSGATINNLSQTGGQTNNGGTVTTASVSGGGYEGNGADTVPGRIGKITTESGPVYFGSLSSALEYAAGMTPAGTIELLADISGENVTFTKASEMVTLDLKGHKLDSTTKLNTSAGTNLTIKDSTSTKGTVEAEINNGGRVIIEGITVSGNVNNEGTLTNQGTITGTTTNEGTFNNEGTAGDVNQTGGSFNNSGTAGNVNQTGGTTDNTGTLADVDLVKGGFKGSQPTTPIDNAEAKIGDTIYGTLEDAVDKANNSDEDVTIELIGGVTLPETPGLTIDNTNGHEVSIDLKGHAISGGIIRTGNGIGDGPVTIKDSIGGGSVGSKIQNDGELNVNSPVTVSGDMTNNGTASNGGTITGTITNKGDFNNESGGTVNNVTQDSGSFNNGGRVSGDLTQNGGSVENQGTVHKAIINGGTYTGDGTTSQEENSAKVSVTKDDGTTKYYASVSEALADTTGSAVIKLNADITDEAIVINKPGITLDLNGKNIASPATVTVAEGTTGATITNSKDTGSVSGDVTNKGSLVISSSVEVQKVYNEGTLENNGRITILLSNKGEAVNNGTIAKVEQESGTFENNSSVGELILSGGSFEGNTPETPLTNGVAKIGNKIYGDLASAIEEANEADEDVTITLLEDATLPGSFDTSIGNENGNKIKLNLNGHDVSGGRLDIKAPGEVQIADATGEGTVESDIKVLTGAKLDVTAGTEIEGNVDNAGTLNNNGSISGTVTNAGNFTNNGDVLNRVTNRGTFNNSSPNGFVSGSFTNEGTVVNGGNIAGDVTNTGSFDNDGNLGSNVTNSGSGSMDNSGIISGQLTNKDNAQTKNSGNINQLNLTGGRINNSGNINSATVPDLSRFAGKEPGNGLTGANTSITYTDGNGDTVTEYYASIDDALTAIGNKNLGGDTPVTLQIRQTPTTISTPVTIPDGVTLDVPSGKELVIAAGGSLTNNGEINNSGNITNNGTITNTGAIKNNGDISNKGTGLLDNAGTLNNGGGTLNGAEGSTGTIKNSGEVKGGTINGPFENESTGTISKPAKMTGNIDNSGKIEVTPETDVEDVEIDNKEGSEYVVITPPAPVAPAGGGSQDNDGDIGESSESNTTAVAPVTPSETEKVLPVDEVAPLVNGRNDQTSEETKSGTDIISSQGMTVEEVREILESSTEESKEKVKELISQAIEEGNINVVRTVPNTSDSSDKQDVIAASISEDSLGEVIDEILTNDEKMAVLSGSVLSLRTEVKVEISESISELDMEPVENSIPEGKQGLSRFTVKLYKQIDGGEEELVNSSKLKVTIEIPEKDRLEDENAVYSIMRIYTDEAGNVHTEIIEAAQDGYMLTFDADTESEYIIIADNLVPLSQGPIELNTEEGEQVDLEAEDKQSNGALAAIAILMLGVGGFFLVGKKRKSSEK